MFEKIKAKMRKGEKKAEAEAELKNQKTAEINNINKQLEKIRFFPESKEEYEKFIGYKVEIIDTGNRELGVAFRHMPFGEGYKCLEPLKCKKQLLEMGIEALVNCQYTADFIGGGFSQAYEYSPVHYGLPVKRIE